MRRRITGVAALLAAVIVLTGCGTNQARSSAAMACAGLGVVDVAIRSKGEAVTPEIARAVLGAVPDYAERAADADPQYEQLALLTLGLEKAILAQEEAWLSLMISAEMECERLGIPAGG